MRRTCTALALGLGLAAWLHWPAVAGGSTGPASGVAPHLVLEDLEGRSQDLRALRGRIVLVNFWATWCVPCREEMPILAAMQDRYGDRGVQVIAASTDEAGSRDKVGSFAAEHGLNFPVWVGATTRDMERLGLGQALPATAVLDREGRIVSRILGPVTRKDLRRRIEWLLDAPPVLVDNSGSSKHDHVQHGAGDEAEGPGDHHHEGDHGHRARDHGDHGDDHEHGGVGMEGASLVPS